MSVATDMDADRLRVQLATALAENRRLRRMTTNGRVGRILHRTAADARTIVAWRFAGYSVSRRQCASYGLGFQRWSWAVALLRAAGVIAWPGNDTDAFQVEDVTEVLDKLDREVRRIEAAGDLARLEFRRYRRRKRL